MRFNSKTLVALAALTVCLTAIAGATTNPVNVDIYSNYVCCSGSGTPYSGFVGSFTSPDIMFATNNGYYWYPFGLTNYAADITSSITVASAGTYTFTLNSDDGSQLFIDGGLVVDDGGAHPPTTISNSISLTAGVHSLEVQFFECCGGTAGVDAYLPQGVTYGATPEPSSLMLLGTGLAGLAGVARRKFLR